MSTSESAPGSSSQGVEVKLTKKAIEEFNQMRSEQRVISQKIGEIDFDLNEHRMVLQVLEKVPKERKCFRLVGGVLIEKTVEDATVELNESSSKMQKAVKTLQEKLSQKGKELADFAQANGLTTHIRSQLASQAAEKNEPTLTK